MDRMQDTAGIPADPGSCNFILSCSICGASPSLRAALAASDQGSDTITPSDRTRLNQFSDTTVSSLLLYGAVPPWRCCGYLSINLPRGVFLSHWFWMAHHIVINPSLGTHRPIRSFFSWNVAADPLAPGFGLTYMLCREKLLSTAFDVRTTPSPLSGVMRLLCFIPSVVIALHSAVGATAGKGRRSTVNGTSATILTPDFVESVQEIVDSEGIPGLTVAIVNKTGPAEFGAWGIKSENGTKMTTDVR